MKDKATHKIQALLTEEEFVMLQRIMFWDGVNGKKFRGLSSWVRNLIQEEIDRRPDSDKQSLKNVRR